MKSARMANITKSTAFKYLKNGLSEEINRIRKKYIEESFKKLEYASIKATDTIIDLLNAKSCANNTLYAINKNLYTLFLYSI